MKIAASLLSADFMELKKSISRVQGVDFLHVDVMDGHFVPNLTFGPCVLKNISRHFDIPLDVHLMVSDPFFGIDLFKEFQPAFLSVHAESTPHLHKAVHQIKDLNIKVGVSLNPATPLAVLEWLIDDVDLVLLMSVNPGFGGQAFLPATLDKLRAFKAKFPHYRGEISIDGGVNATNAPVLRAYGATLLVVGSYLFNHEDPHAALEQLHAPLPLSAKA